MALGQKNSRLGKNEIKASLEQTLSEIECSGSFLTSGSFQSGINPGLEVSGAGPISLPLLAETAKKIIQASHVSPYGKGGKTLVDKSVRKSWELNADQFSLRNPAWSRQIEKLLQAAVSGLGLMTRPTEIKAELYKLLVYEEGAFFLPHQDSEKADGMFGTLVVSLPSKHEGGDVVATHRGESLTFSSSLGSDFGFSYAAWYSDVTHEVKTVTSGYRLVLTYNLIHQPLAALLERQDKNSAKLISLLESWAVLCDEVYPSKNEPVEWLPDEYNDNDDCPRALLYTLDHQYTSAELSFSRLKGIDQGQVSEARRACEKTGFSVFLVNIEKSEMGAVEEDWDSGYDRDSHHYISDLIESSLFLSHIIGPKGRITFSKEVTINNAIFVQEDPFPDEPDHEDFTGFTGNEGATATHIYRLTVKNLSFFTLAGKRCFV
jgi:2OG-Fe(II) oxygenase superfamily